MELMCSAWKERHWGLGCESGALHGGCHVMRTNYYPTLFTKQTTVLHNGGWPKKKKKRRCKRIFVNFAPKMNCWFSILKNNKNKLIIFNLSDTTFTISNIQKT